MLSSVTPSLRLYTPVILVFLLSFSLNARHTPGLSARDDHLAAVYEPPPVKERVNEPTPTKKEAQSKRKSDRPQYDWDNQDDFYLVADYSNPDDMDFEDLDQEELLRWTLVAMAGMMLFCGKSRHQIFRRNKVRA